MQSKKPRLYSKSRLRFDARYGTVSKLRAELTRAVDLKVNLQDALNESLRPLPELQSAIATLDLRIQEINSTLKQGSIAPDTARLEEVSLRLNSAQTIEEALAVKASVTNDITRQVWSHNESAKALELVNRRVLTLYVSARSSQPCKTRRSPQDSAPANATTMSHHSRRLLDSY
jgi:chromosome segregation ATPase